jgi:arylsulfatase A-like enzyme
MRNQRKSQSRALRVAAALALACAVGALTWSAGAAPAAGQPNIVVIQTDDQTLADLTATYTDPATGQPVPVMPNTLNSIAAQGVTFSRYYVSMPLCCPSRSTLLTGQYSHNTGVLTNFFPSGGYYKFNKENNLAVWLQNAGYYTMHDGKFMNEYGQNDPTEEPPGWSDWHTVIGDARLFYGYQLNENGKVTGPHGDDTYAQEDPSGCPDHPPTLQQCNYLSDVITNDAVAGIGKVPSGKPFYLQVDYTAPHGDINPPPGPEPAQRDKGTLAGVTAPRVPGFNESDMSDKPEFVRNNPRLGFGRIGYIDQRYENRLESLRAVDQGVQRIIDRLNASGQLANTYIFFISDNGFFQGEHRFDAAKFLAYEPSNHLPLLVRGPGIAPGSVSNELVGNFDIAPTIVALTGAQPQLNMDGRSLLPYAQDTSLKSRRPLLLEGFTGTGEEGTTSTQRASASIAASPRDYEGIRFGPYKLVQYRSGAKELYDLLNDPYELHSRNRDPRYRLIKAWLLVRLARLETCAGPSCRKPLIGKLPKVLPKHPPKPPKHANTQGPGTNPAKAR